jgi:ABC-type siderophore export system fused ATPase/permease subunit
MAVATPVLAAVPIETPCGKPLATQFAQAAALVREQLAQPEQADRLHAALARLARLHDTAMSARRIQGGVLSAGQRERLSHRIAAATFLR